MHWMTVVFSFTLHNPTSFPLTINGVELEVESIGLPKQTINHDIGPKEEIESIGWNFRFNDKMMEESKTVGGVCFVISGKIYFTDCIGRTDIHLFSASLWCGSEERIELLDSTWKQRLRRKDEKQN